MSDAEYRRPSADWYIVTSVKRTATAGFAGKAGSWWQPPKRVAARREIEEAALAVRDFICPMAGIKVLLLPQSSCKFSSRRPERKQSLSILVLCSCERCLLLQQSAKQNCLLRVSVSMVAKSFLFRVASALRHSKLCSGFAQLTELRVNVQENLVSRILFGEDRFVFRDDLLGNIVALLAPVPGLPRKQSTYGTDILRKEADARGGQIVNLNRDIGQVPRLLNPGLDVRLILLNGSNPDLRALRQRELSSRLQIQLFRQSRRHRLHRKLDEKVSAKQAVQGFLPVRKRVLDHHELIPGFCLFSLDTQTVRFENRSLLQPALGQMVKLFKRSDGCTLRFGLALGLEQRIVGAADIAHQLLIPLRIALAAEIFVQSLLSN